MTLVHVGPADRPGARAAAHRGSSVGAVVAVAAVSLAVAAIGIGLYAAVRARALAAPARAHEHGERLLALERAVHVDIERGVQALALRSPSLMGVLDTVYALGYWPVLVAVAVVLVRCDRRLALRFGAAVLVSGLVGMVVFAIVPMAPPRLLEGFVDTVARRPGLAALAQPRGLANPYAAMPSFHVGWVVLATVAAGRVVRGTGVRRLLVLPGTVMTVAVIATGNHYVLDVVAGVAVSLGGWVVAGRCIERVDADAPARRRQRLYSSGGEPIQRAQHR